MMEKRYEIFISSTYDDLVKEREKVIRALLRSDCFPVSMEYFPAIGMPPISLIEKVLKDCDYFILIIGDRYGSIYEDGKSFTETEYIMAKKEGIPVIAFLHRGSDSLSCDVSDEGVNKLESFKEEVRKGNQYVREWSTPDELESLVSSSLSWVKELQPRRGWARSYSKSLTNPQVHADKGSYIIKLDDVEFKMIHVEGGEFTMGDLSKKKVQADKVEVKDFWIGETPVTQALWVKAMGYNPSYFSKSHGRTEDDLRLPVEQVSLNDCREFIDKLNSALKGKLGDGLEFDLPTEEQWEFAARGGNRSNGYLYSGADKGYLDKVARYDHNAGGKTWPVGQSGLDPNELGLYDMSGNVWEWTQSVFKNTGSVRKPRSSAARFVGRGGCWHSEEECCRVSYRASANATHAGNGLGLRLVLIRKGNRA